MVDRPSAPRYESEFIARGEKGRPLTGRLEGKVAVVTGGASGIGDATVRLFVDEGASVVIADVQDDLGHELQAELGENARFLRTDVSQEADVSASVDLAVSSFGRLDIMYNNAGVLGAIGPIVDTTEEVWNTTVAIVLTGTFFGMKHAARVMIPRRAGTILSTASIAGVAGGVGPHAYTACKHGVVGLTKSAASELGQHGIRVNAIAPGSMVSAMTAMAITGDHTDLESATKAIAAESPLRIAGLATDIADAALYLASDEARYVSGHCLVVDAGLTTNAGSAEIHAYRPAVLGEAGRREVTG